MEVPRAAQSQACWAVLSATHCPGTELPCAFEVCSSQPPRKGNKNCLELNQGSRTDLGQVRQALPAPPKPPKVALGKAMQKTWEAVIVWVLLPPERQLGRLFLPAPLLQPVGYVTLWTWATLQLCLPSEALGPLSPLCYTRLPQPEATHVFCSSEPTSRSSRERNCVAFV